MKTKTENKCTKLIILSLVLLFNPTVSIVDILPDFIAWLILAKIFERAADSAAYFEEARVAFMRLAWVNLAKLPIFMLILFLRGSGPVSGDTFALASLVFSTLEIIFIVPAVKSIFEALFHVGERSDAKALLSPITESKKPNREFTPESLRGLTMLFLVCKSILSALPDFFLLSGDADSGHVMTSFKYYPIAVILAMALGFTLGGIWLSKSVKYVKKISSEGLFFCALDKIATESSKEKFEAKVKIRKINFALTFLAITAFSSLELVFDNFNGINILPRFIYGIFLIISILLIQKHGKSRKAPLISACAYALFATIAFIFNARFLTKYSYLDLTANDSAKNAYLFVEIFGALEFILLTVTMILITKYLLSDFILMNTGISPESERYRRTEREYHKSLIKKAYLLSAFGIIGGLARLVNIFLNRDVQLIFSDISDITRPSFSASALPWFNLVVTATAIIYIGYSLYYTSTLKEEVDMKYTFE